MALSPSSDSIAAVDFVRIFGHHGQEQKQEPTPPGFAQLRVHDLKHTFGHRLEAAGVSDRDCQALLGHARKGVTHRYMAPEVARLLQAAESVLETEHRGTVPLTIIRRKVA